MRTISKLGAAVAGVGGDAPSAASDSAGGSAAVMAGTAGAGAAAWDAGAGAAAWGAGAGVAAWESDGAAVWEVGGGPAAGPGPVEVTATGGADGASKFPHPTAATAMATTSSPTSASSRGRGADGCAFGSRPSAMGKNLALLVCFRNDMPAAQTLADMPAAAKDAAMDPPGSPPETQDKACPVRVWDAPIRLFHWLAVVLIAALYASWRVNWMDWHATLGDVLLALLIFRLLWGFFGSETARFARFAATPQKALRHLAQLARREPDRTVGHNPAGAWMVFFFLGLLFVQSLSGIYINNDIADAGPFTEIVPAPIANAIDALHSILWDVLLVAIALHVLAILAYALLKGQNLTLPMVTGWKRLPLDVAAPRLAHPLLALALLVASAAAAAACSIFL